MELALSTESWKQLLVTSLLLSASFVQANIMDEFASTPVMHATEAYFAKPKVGLNSAIAHIHRFANFLFEYFF